MSAVMEPTSSGTDPGLVERMVSINISPRHTPASKNTSTVSSHSKSPSSLTSPSAAAAASPKSLHPTLSSLETDRQRASSTEATSPPVDLKTLATIAQAVLRSRPASPLSRVSSPGIIATALFMGLDGNEGGKREDDENDDDDDDDDDNTNGESVRRFHRNEEATTFFDDVVNAPTTRPANIVTLSPTTQLLDVYERFFEGHADLLLRGHCHNNNNSSSNKTGEGEEEEEEGQDDKETEKEQGEGHYFRDPILYSSEDGLSEGELDMEMEMVMDSPPLLLRRARAMADQRQMHSISR
ncbi:hypothetical protein BGZ94_007193 [Podila epigama]|nr:hypothetical protein BGZ94_007193 [Podila epigama]